MEILLFFLFELLFWLIHMVGGLVSICLGVGEKKKYIYIHIHTHTHNYYCLKFGLQQPDDRDNYKQQKSVNFKKYAL